MIIDPGLPRRDFYRRKWLYDGRGLELIIRVDEEATVLRLIVRRPAAPPTLVVHFDGQELLDALNVLDPEQYVRDEFARQAERTGVLFDDYDPMVRTMVLWVYRFQATGMVCAGPGTPKEREGIREFWRLAADLGVLGADDYLVQGEREMAREGGMTTGV